MCLHSKKKNQIPKAITDTCITTIILDVYSLKKSYNNLLFCKHWENNVSYLPGQSFPFVFIFFMTLLQY